MPSKNSIENAGHRSDTDKKLAAYSQRNYNEMFSPEN